MRDPDFEAGLGALFNLLGPSIQRTADRLGEHFVEQVVGTSAGRSKAGPAFDGVTRPTPIPEPTAGGRDILLVFQQVLDPEGGIGGERGAPRLRWKMLPSATKTDELVQAYLSDPNVVSQIVVRGFLDYRHNKAEDP